MINIILIGNTNLNDERIFKKKNVADEVKKSKKKFAKQRQRVE